MSYNGSGTFNINTAGQPVVTGTVISSTAFNLLTSDLASGLSTALTKDGQTTPTANIPMGTFKITGLGAGTVATDAAQYGQLQAGATTIATVSGTDTLTGSLTPAITAYATGNLFSFVAVATNTGATTINLNSLGAKSITKSGTTALAAGDLVSGQVYLIEYDGTRFQLINPSVPIPTGILPIVNGGTGASTLAGANIAVTNAAQTFTGGQRGAVTALTSSSASIAINLATNCNFSYTTTENSTLAAPSNAVAGQSGIITITQGATAYTLAYNTFYKFAGGTVPTLTATVGAVDTFAYYVESASRATCQLIKDVK